VTGSGGDSGFPSSAPWLARALVVSVALHAAIVWVGARALAPAEQIAHVERIDIEIAPRAPLAEALPPEVAAPGDDEVASQPTAMASAEPPHREAAAPVDGGVDAARRPDAPLADAGVDAASDAAEQPMVASNEPDPRAGSGSGSGSGSGTGSGSGSGSVDLPAVTGAPTTAGTAANLLSFFPRGHILTALVRFDRLRGTEWAALAEAGLRPLPDYRDLFGDRAADIAARLDTVVVSTPRPRDATTTTLVVHTTRTRAQMRELLASPGAPIAWSAARGGAFGKRTSPLVGDTRVVLSPWRGWYVLAPAADFGDTLYAADGDVDTCEAQVRLPAWLDKLRAIEAESGSDARGPALVVTLAGKAGRYKLPDFGIGVTSLPSPERVSLAMELVPQGWLVRGNITFATEAAAAEFVQSMQTVQQRLDDSHLLKLLIRRQHALALVTGLSFARAGVRVSYATSMSIADARELLGTAVATVSSYFAASRKP
jgi:hypothetical protein